MPHGCGSTKKMSGSTTALPINAITGEVIPINESDHPQNNRTISHPMCCHRTPTEITHQVADLLLWVATSRKRILADPDVLDSSAVKRFIQRALIWLQLDKTRLRSKPSIRHDFLTYSCRGIPSNKE